MMERIRHQTALECAEIVGDFPARIANLDFAHDPNDRVYMTVLAALSDARDAILRKYGIEGK